MASLNAFHKVNPKVRLSASVGRDGRRVLAQLQAHYKHAHGFEPAEGDLLEQLLLAWLKQDKDLQAYVGALSESEAAAIERELDTAEEKASRAAKKGGQD